MRLGMRFHDITNPETHHAFSFHFICMPTQVLNRITHSKEYTHGDFYIFACEYDHDREDDAIIIQQGTNPQVIGANLADIKFNDNLNGDANRKLGQKLAKDEVIPW